MTHASARRRVLCSIPAIACTGLAHARLSELSEHIASIDRGLFERIARRVWLARMADESRTVADQSTVDAIVRAARASVRVSAEASAVDFWQRHALKLIQKYRLNPLRAARSLSYLAIAMHDAGVERIAHEAVASEALAYFFPEEPHGSLRLQAVQRASMFAASASSVRTAWLRGVASARAAMNACARRRQRPRRRGCAASERSATRHTAALESNSSTVGLTPGRTARRKLENLVGAGLNRGRCCTTTHVESRAICGRSARVVRNIAPLVGGGKRSADEWNLDLGTVTPAGVWVMRALDLPELKQLPIDHQTAALALLATTMLDAFIACWAVKFRWWTERPVTAIRRDIDAEFLLYLVTPSFPGYVSGHATVSGAAAAVLSRLFPPRSAELLRAAEEAAHSRLLGGIHVRSDNAEGLRLGLRVGAAAVDRAS